VREDAVDFYLRSRSDLLKSIIDGIDYEFNLGNYLASQINLQRHNLIIEKSIEDYLCESVVRKELTEEELERLNELREIYAKTRDLNVMVEAQQIHDAAREREVTPKNKDDYKMDRIRFRHGAEMIVPKHEWHDRIAEHSLEDIHSLWPKEKVDMNEMGQVAYPFNHRPYANIHPFDEKSHPLRKINTVTGRPEWIELLRSFYLPETPDGISESENYKQYEADEEKYHQKQKHALYHGVLKEDENGIERKHYPYIGPLNNGNGELGHLHDIYNHHYENWKDDNLDLVHDTMKQYPDSKIHDFILRQKHFEDAADEWLDEENYVHYDPADYLKNRGVYSLTEEEMKGYGVRKSMSDKSYHMGLEWLTPKQRHRVMKHLHEKGSDAHDAQIIDVGDGLKISMGRIKRNLRQRVSPEFKHYTRGVQFPGPNLHAHIESPNDHPEGLDALAKKVYGHALEETKMDDGKIVHEVVLNEINNLLFGPDADEEGILSHIPNMKNISKYKKIAARKLKNEEYSNEKDALLATLLDADMLEEPVHQNADNFYTMLGYNPKTKEAYRSGEHPIYPNFEQPFISLETIEKVAETAKNMTKLAFEGKQIRNGEGFHHIGHNGVDINDIDPDFADAWPIGEDGHPIGLAAHWERPFQEQGGRGKHALSLLQMMHESYPKDDNGFSIVGRVNHHGMFEYNPKTLGLYGPYIPHLSDKEDFVHHRPEGILSLWPSSSPYQMKSKAPSSMKNNANITATSLSPEYSNKVRYLLGDELKTTFAQETGSALSHTLFHKSRLFNDAFASIGGMGNRPTHSISNSRNNHSHLTRLGSLAKPHEPMKAQILTIKDIESGRFPISHSQDNKKAFYEHQEHKGLTQTEEGKFVGDDDELDAKQNEYDKLQISFDKLRGDEEIKQASEKLRALEEEIRILENKGTKATRVEGRGKSRKGRKTARGFHNARKKHEDKDFYDYDAIVQMAKKLKPLFLKEDPNAFSADDPEKYHANTARLLYDANRALMILPHEYHGLTTWGYDIDDVKGKTASQIMDVIPHREVAQGIYTAQKEIHPNHSVQTILKTLGYPDDDAHRQLAQRIKEQIDGPVYALSHGDTLRNIGEKLVNRRGENMKLHGDKDENGNYIIDDHHAAMEEWRYSHPYYSAKGREKNKLKNRFKDAWSTEYGTKLGHIPGRLFHPREEQHVNEYGLSYIPLTPRHMKRGGNIFGSTDGVIEGRHNKMKSAIHDVILMNPATPGLIDAMNNPQVSEAPTLQQAKWGSGRQIHPAWSTQGHKIQNLYISNMDNGWIYQPTLGLEFGGGKPIIGTNTTEQYLPSVPSLFHTAIHGEDTWKQVQSTNWVHPQIAPNSVAVNAISGMSGADDPNHIAKNEEEMLTILMNPDVLLKSKEGKPPPILPMHRIFSLKDFNSLRGFSGDWAVSSFPSGERMIIQRKSNRVSAYDENGETITLNDEERKHLRSIGDKNYIIDALRVGVEIQIVDILQYDETKVSDMDVRERIKVLRGQFDSYENVIVPGPHNFRITDTEGLEDVVKDLTDNNKQILLRDANSTYMSGERRHPKWFVLRPDKNIPLIVLDVRGKGPYTYRLGAGPLDAEGFGNRGVEYEGESYLDVGTVRSPKAFEEGEIISVGISGVRSHKRNGVTIYTITPTKIRGESEEGASSLETLSLLTKSHPIIPVEYSIEIEDERLILSFPELDNVIYKMEEHRAGRWVHSPQSSLGSLMKSDYPVILAESLRPLWSEAVALMIKGKVRSMSDPKNRERVEEESGGIIDADDEENIIKPEEIEVMTKTLIRIADLVDRVEKEKMSGGPAARAYGIDMGSAIQSPRGPTRLTSEQSMPDWDMLERPTEDPEEEYPHAKKKRRILEEHDEIEVGDSGP